MKMDGDDVDALSLRAVQHGLQLIFVRGEIGIRNRVVVHGQLTKSVTNHHESRCGVSPAEASVLDDLHRPLRITSALKAPPTIAPIKAASHCEPCMPGPWPAKNSAHYSARAASECCSEK